MFEAESVAVTRSVPPPNLTLLVASPPSSEDRAHEAARVDVERASAVEAGGQGAGVGPGGAASAPTDRDRAGADRGTTNHARGVRYASSTRNSEHTGATTGTHAHAARIGPDRIAGAAAHVHDAEAADRTADLAHCVRDASAANDVQRTGTTRDADGNLTRVGPGRATGAAAYGNRALAEGIGDVGSSVGNASATGDGQRATTRVGDGQETRVVPSGAGSIDDYRTSGGCRLIGDDAATGVVDDIAASDGHAAGRGAADDQATGGPRIIRAVVRCAGPRNAATVVDGRLGRTVRDEREHKNRRDEPIGCTHDESFPVGQALA